MAKKKSKWKKIAKNVGKAAAIAGALYGGSKLFGKKSGVVGVRRPGDSSMPGNLGDYGFKTPKPYHPSEDINVSYSAKGGRIGKKGGGRTGKQFGGGLGSTARRDMRSGYYPSDMGMRGGTMYKKGGRVKSMGAAKRGGGVAKR